MVREQIGKVPVHAPVHRENVDPPSGAAVRVTAVPALYDVLGGLTETVPAPVPDLFTVKLKEAIPSWVTVNAFPAIFKVPVLGVASGLARTE